MRLSQINVIIQIRLKIKLWAVFINWGSRINFLFVGQQDIVNNKNFPSTISRNYHKRLLPKITWQDQSEKFLKMFLWDRLVYFADFVGRTLLAILSLLPQPKCFSRVCFPTLLQLSWNFFYHWQHQQFLAQQIPTNQHPRVLQRGQKFHAKGELQFSREIVQAHQTPAHVVDQYSFRMEFLLVLNQSSCNVF